MYDTLLVNQLDQVVTVTINRPAKLNALNAQVISELTLAFQALEATPAETRVRAAILTGAGEKAFVAGADIAEMSGLSAARAYEFSAAGHRLGRLLESVSFPIIAAVNGFALGGGCEIAMACHIRIASEHAKFGQPEVKLGILPGYGGTQRLPRLVGKGRALQMLMTGEMIDAEEALRIGLVNRVVHAAELLGAAQILLRQIMQNAPLAVALCIEAVDRGLGMTLEEGLTLEANHFGLLAATDDMQQGMTAFLEKKPPNFSGR